MFTDFDGVSINNPQVCLNVSGNLSSLTITIHWLYYVKIPKSLKILQFTKQRIHLLRLYRAMKPRPKRNIYWIYFRFKLWLNSALIHFPKYTSSGYLILKTSFWKKVLWCSHCRQCNIYVNTTQNSLLSQLVPLNPTTQAQVYESTPSLHVPPFWHGFGAQSSISKVKIWNC